MGQHIERPTVANKGTCWISRGCFPWNVIFPSSAYLVVVWHDPTFGSEASNIQGRNTLIIAPHPCSLPTHGSKLPHPEAYFLVVLVPCRKLKKCLANLWFKPKSQVSFSTCTFIDSKGRSSCMNTFTHQGVSPLPEARGASAAFAKRTLDGGKPPEKKKPGFETRCTGRKNGA